MAARWKRAGTISAAVLGAFVLALCGCGASSTSSIPTPSRPMSTSEGGAGTQTRQNPGRTTVPLRVSGGGSAQFRVERGDNSIQEYGEEAGEADLRQAAEATHSLLVARVRGEWARACGLLAAEERKSLVQQVAQLSQSPSGSCPAALALVTKPVSGSLAREITQVDAASLRRDGVRAFLLYVGAPEGTVYAMPLQLEGGIWRPVALGGNALPGVNKR